MTNRESFPLRRRSKPVKRRSSSSHKGGIASITVRKRDPRERMGITVEEVDGRYSVTNISETSMFLGSELQVGDILLSVNGTNARNAFIKELIVLGDHADDKVTIVVRQATSAGLSPKGTKHGNSVSCNANEVMVEKEKNEDVGIRFRVEDNKLVVSKILRGSVFQDTKLQVGDRVSKVNEMDFYSYADADYALRIANKRGSQTLTLQLRPRNE